MIYPSKVKELINPSTNRRRAQLPGRPNKQLLGEAKDNQKQLRKGADSHKRFIRAGRDQEQSNNQRSNESTSETNGLVRLNAIGRLSKHSTEQ